MSKTEDKSNGLSQILKTAAENEIFIANEDDEYNAIIEDAIDCLCENAKKLNAWELEFLNGIKQRYSYKLKSSGLTRKQQNCLFDIWGRVEK